MRKLSVLLKRATLSALLVILAAAATYAGPAEKRINSRIQTLQRQIDGGVKSGALTAEESGSLQSRLDKIREQVDKSAENKYGLSSGEAQSINNRLDSIAKDVGKQKKDVQTARSDDRIIHRMDEYQKRIDKGYNDGSLNGSEAKSLNARLENIRKHFESAGKNGLSEQEIKSINHKLDVLEKDIYKERRDKQRAR